MTINGDGEQLRDYVYVGDCARANVMALASDKSGTIYNLGTGKGTSVNDIFNALKSITAYPRDAVHGPAKVGETRHIYLDVRKAQQELGWQPLVNLEEGLGRVAAHHRAAEMNA